MVTSMPRKMRAIDCHPTSYQLFKQDIQTERYREVKPALFLEFCSHSEIGANEDLYAAKHICIDEFGATNFRSASDEMTRHSLWAARHRLYYSSIALKEGAKMKI
jgi:hypothetical protein